MAGIVVGKGCVGECGATSTIEYTVKSKIEIMMIVENVKTDLCPNTGAHAWIFVNGREAATGPITNLGSKINAPAKPGSKIIVHVVTYPLFNEIACVRLGELHYNLIQMDLVA